MRKVVVTGGAGFIGSHLTQELAMRGYHVIILDDLSTGSMDNIAGLSTQPSCSGGVQFVHDSITSLPMLYTLFQDVDYVFHLAAIASVSKSVQDPLSTHSVNMSGTLNVLLAAEKNKVKRVVFSSSAAVYGDTAALPQKEEMMPAPQSPYAVTKLAGEYYCQVFQEVYNLDTICLRFFNIYGPGQDPHSQYAAVIPRFVSTALDGKAPIIFGDGEQTRDFVFVRDAVVAIIQAAESNATGIFNVGTGSKITINDLASLVLKITGKDLKPVHQKSKRGEIKHSLADISKARAFDYFPKYSLEEGLKETIGYLQR